MARRNPTPPTPHELPNAEAEVLAFVQQTGSATTREVSEGMTDLRPMGTSAAQALLLRLESKGLLRREKIKGTKAFRYIPTPRAEPVQKNLARRFVDRLFAGSAAQLMASLFDSRHPSPEEIAKLRQLIDEAQRRTDDQ